jgi:hypothetical protein
VCWQGAVIPARSPPADLRTRYVRRRRFRLLRGSGQHPTAPQAAPGCAARVTIQAASSDPVRSDQDASTRKRLRSSANWRSSRAMSGARPASSRSSSAIFAIPYQVCWCSRFTGGDMDHERPPQLLAPQVLRPVGAIFGPPSRWVVISARRRHRSACSRSPSEFSFGTSHPP